MQHLARAETRSLEDYEAMQTEFRADVRAVKAPRRVSVGDAMALTFENRGALPGSGDAAHRA